MKIIDYINKNHKINEIVSQIQAIKVYKNCYLGNIANNFGKMITANYFLKEQKTIVYLTSNIYHATKAYDIFLDFLGKEKVSFFPGEEFVSSELVASSSVFRLARMNTIARILNNETQIIVTNTEGLLKNIMSTKSLKESIITICKGDIVNKEDLIKKLVVRGYKKQVITENPGTFSVRGEVIDIYPINYDDPIRLNFFDNEVETIKIFNVETQMSIKKKDEIEVYPFYEIFYNDIDNIKKKIEKAYPASNKLQNDLNNLENYENLDQLYLYLPEIDDNYQNFLDFTNVNTLFIEEFNDVIEKEVQAKTEITEYLEKINFKINSGFLQNVEDVIANKKIIFLNTYLANINSYKFDVFLDAETTNNFEYNNNIRNMLEDLKINKEKTYIITHTDEQKLVLIQDSLNNKGIEYSYIQDLESLKKHKINIMVLENAYGYIDNQEQFELITPNEYASGKINRKGKYQNYYKNTVKIYNKEELQIGDYVVHQNYGIGQYMGIETVELQNIRNDYLVLVYSNNSKLKIPVENIYVLEKYLGNKERIPKLSNINSKEWTKKKARVQEKVAELAERLIKIQAERALKKGFKYQEDTLDQVLFEKDFGFTETEDQRKAIHDVKEDLENGKLMDRLLCGDVGFGKTEVAMRAAFKVVEGGKQVAYLAPTTVLTRQHFYTFKERLEQYGVKVELINRFISESKQKEIITGLKSGYVDIVIGTHRLLSKDIKFKDLGLLIIDEEQRFGVEHKERLKELKTDVNVLSLSATPIPRTLQMSLLGIKDLSIIETPPYNRVPVQTYLLESNDSVIRESINRELGRKGQVFYLLNRIGELDMVLRKLKRLVPNARVGIIHGKLTKEEIENVIQDFLEQKLDVLTCTTIIETGIDIPNANTLIVERADILGLSQLYQIRGRVGRSDRVAYAYFMYDKNKVLTQASTKRLEAIKEFTALGSGYKIAMRDLSIRGAGDILGSDQSGFIDDIGITLYIKMLNEEVAKRKGKFVEADETHKFNVEVSHHIDALYVGDDALRIEMHKSINKVKSRKQQQLILREFNDRYGEVKEEIKLYIEAKYLEHLLKIKNIEKFKETADEVVLNYDEAKSSTINGQEFFHVVSTMAPKFQLKYQSRKIHILIKRKDFPKSYIYSLTKILEKF